MDSTFKDIVKEEGFKPKTSAKTASQAERSSPSPRPARANASRKRAGANSRKAPPRKLENIPTKWKASGVRDTQMRRLCAGKMRPCSKCDLHGKTRPAARDLLRKHIEDCRAKGCSVMRVVCGRGIHSEDQDPVLRPAICEFLYEHTDVLAYCLMPKNDGALYVLLK